MVIPNRTRSAAGLTNAAVWILAGIIAPAQGQVNSATQSYGDDGVSNVSIQIDNDLLAGSDGDRDYTGGVGATLSGAAARGTFVSLDPLLAAIDQVTDP